MYKYYLEFKGFAYNKKYKKEIVLANLIFLN